MKNDKGETISDFIGIVVWGKQAENLCQYVDKGRLLAIEGSIQTGNYTDKDGNKRTSFDVRADRVEFLDSNKNAQNFENTVQSSIEEDPYAAYGEQIEIDDDFLD